MTPELDPGRIETFMRERVAGFGGPVSVQRFAGGQSNPTYLLVTPDKRYVVRCKPRGPLAGSAHAIEREYAILSALAGRTDVPVPRTFAICTDDAVVGSSFYVMEYVDGRIFEDASLPGIAREARAAYYLSLVDGLARIHLVDDEAVGLGHLRRPGSYFTRQIDRWSRQYAQDAAAGRVPVMERLLEWLAANAPEDAESALIHGDYRFGNVIFDAVRPSVLAVLDWELATVGHPLADLAHLLMSYRMPTLGISGLRGRDLAGLGLPSEDQLVRRYCERTGRRDAPHLEYCLAFSLFRLAAIFHGIRGRLLRGTASSASARDYARHVETLAELAWEQAERAATCV